MAFSLTSTAFHDGSAIPKKYTCDGEDLSPPLQWREALAGTQSFALVMDDPDAPPGTWVPWVIYNLPATSVSLPEGVAKSQEGPDGSMQGLVWGVDTFSRIGYYGPCPPPGKPHHYYFTLYALHAPLHLPPKATKPQLDGRMQGHILGQAVWMGTYGR